MQNKRDSRERGSDRRPLYESVVLFFLLTLVINFCLMRIVGQFFNQDSNQLRAEKFSKNIFRVFRARMTLTLRKMIYELMPFWFRQTVC